MLKGVTMETAWVLKLHLVTFGSARLVFSEDFALAVSVSCRRAIAASRHLY